MEKEKEKRSVGPSRLTYNHSLTLAAGQKCIEKLSEELDNPHGKEWAEEWVVLAKKKESIGPLEFLSTRTDTSEEKLLGIATRLIGIPPVDCETVVGSYETHFIIEGLPMTLLSGTEFGVKTLVHCVPFLETVLDRDLLCDIYKAIKINFVMTTYEGLLKHIQRTYNSGRAKHRLLLLGDGETNPHFKREISLLRAKELLPKDFPQEATRREIIQTLEDEKPKKGAPGETEWWCLCSDHPFIQLATIASSKDLAEIITPQTQKRHGVIPVCFYGGILTIASKRGMQSVLRQEIVGELQRPCRITTVLGMGGVINEIITSNLSSIISSANLASQIKIEAPDSEDDTEIIDLQELVENDEASIIKVVQSILIGAINKQATDIHVAAHEDRTWIRFRIDGNMVDSPFQLPPNFWKAVISRIKIMSAIDIRYSPTPQDGKFQMKVGSTDYDIRVNTCSTLYGEKAIMRVQRKDSEIPTLESLGFKPHERNLIESLIESDHGMLVICGPTGSGKTKTLSATMYKIDREKWNVITAENPVEIRIPLVEQTPIDSQHMTFGKFVPAALRQDPDYIMIGETRDRETTEEVIRASITGHIVMTTLHTNSAAGVPARLIDMGGEPFLITDSLKVVIAQRLIRKLCTNCSKSSTRHYTDAEWEANGIKPAWVENSEGFLDPVGCKICNHTGYSGRTAISEGYAMSAAIRQIILKEDANTDAIREQMVKQGGKSLFQQAVELAAARITSLAEALAIRSMDI